MLILRNISQASWLEVARKCEYATFFHTPFWPQLATRTYPGYRDLTLGAKLDNGSQVVIPLLGRRSSKGLLQNFVSSFAGCYGGLIADGPISQAEQQSIYQTLLQQCRLGQLQIVGNPLVEERLELKGTEILTDFTQWLPLEGDYDKVFSNFSKGHKSSVKKGRRLGVTTRLAKTLSDYQAYYKVYEDVLRRWGNSATSRYPWLLFENGYYLAQEAPEQIKLWLAEGGEKHRSSQIIAGAWVFYWHQHAVVWHACAHSEFLAFCPGHVLYADIIKDACEKGYSYYDFNPSGGHEGVVSFKKSFGAEQRAINRRLFLPKFDQAIRQIIAKTKYLRQGMVHLIRNRNIFGWI